MGPAAADRGAHRLSAAEQPVEPGVSRLQGARINLLERRFSALPDNDHIATLVRMCGAASAAPTLVPF